MRPPVFPLEGGTLTSYFIGLHFRTRPDGLTWLSGTDKTLGKPQFFSGAIVHKLANAGGHDIGFACYVEFAVQFSGDWHLQLDRIVNL